MRRQRICGLTLAAVLLLLPVLAARAQDGQPTVMTEPTAADFIEALSPRTRSLGADSTTRGLLARPSINIHVRFEFGSARLTDDAKQVLAELAAALASRELSGYRFLIAGHTDTVGSDEFNLLLSERRARAVREYIITIVEVEPGRLQDVGWGEARLIDPGSPEGGVNRRVEITNIGGR